MDYIEDMENKMKEFINYEEKREKLVFCGWCGAREIKKDDKFECPNCDEYFINERVKTK